MFWNVNASIEFLQIHELTNPLVTDPTKTYWPTLDPLHVGVIEEALREFYIRDLELDPTNALGLADSRLIPEMTKVGGLCLLQLVRPVFGTGRGCPQLFDVLQPNGRTDVCHPRAVFH